MTSWDEVLRPAFVQQWLQWLDESSTAHVFFHPSLVRAWVETYLPLCDIRPFFVVGTCGDSIAFLPLVLWRRNWKNAWQRLLVPAGYSDFDYHDPVFSGAKPGKELAADFWNALCEYLPGKMRFDCFTVDGVRQLAAGQGIGWVEDGYCPLTDLAKFKKPEEFLPWLKSSLRGDLRRQLRRIEEVGGLATVTYGNNQVEEALLELPAFLEAHSYRWPGAYKAPRFHENLVRQGLPSGLVSFRVIRIGGVSAAWHLGFRFHRCFYSYMPAMNEKFASMSPGKIMMLYRYEQSIAEGDKVFDHLRGAEDYKEDWSTNKQVVWRFSMRGNDAFGSVRNMFVDRVKPFFAK